MKTRKEIEKAMIELRNTKINDTKRIAELLKIIKG